MTTRRAFLSGLAALVAAPAVIRTPGLLMPVRAMPVGFSLEPVTLGTLVFDEDRWMPGPAYLAAERWFSCQPELQFVSV